MCPLRFILVFFSAILAGYVAWRSVRSPDSHYESNDQNPPPEDEEPFNLKRTVENGFWVFVDMASGRYLWRTLRETKQKL